MERLSTTEGAIECFSHQALADWIVSAMFRQIGFYEE
jgi:hypothetical protein